MSDDCCTTSVYYEPPRSPPAPDGDIPWPFVLPIILFIAALIWLWYLTPEKKKEEKKKVSEQIIAIFNQASTDADAFTRPEVQRPLARVREKVLDVLKAEKIE